MGAPASGGTAEPAPLPIRNVHSFVSASFPGVGRPSSRIPIAGVNHINDREGAAGNAPAGRHLRGSAHRWSQPPLPQPLWVTPGYTSRASSARCAGGLVPGTYVVVLERAWSNLSVQSAMPPPDQSDKTISAGPGWRTRVTPQLRAEVVRRYQAGESSRIVAEELGIGKATVLKLLRLEGVQLKPVGARY